MALEDVQAYLEQKKAELAELGVDLSELEEQEQEENGQVAEWGPLAFFIKDPELAKTFKYIYAQMGLGFLDSTEYYIVSNLVSIALEFVKIEEHYHKVAAMLEKRLEAGEFDEADVERIKKKIEKAKKVNLRPLVELVLSPAMAILRVSGSKNGVLPKLMRSSIQEVRQTIRESEREKKRRLSFPLLGGD